MSEQKAFTSERIYWAVEQVEREAGDIADLHLDDNTFYLKSEADNVIAEKDAEIARLKAIRKVHVEAIESMGAGLHQDEKEIRRLRRALYKACANWADAEVFERTVGIDDLNVEANRWALMRNKCLKKSEEYR
jgi:hypothetical protein